jgi:hypothetical protein
MRLFHLSGQCQCCGQSAAGVSRLDKDPKDIGCIMILTTIPLVFFLSSFLIVLLTDGGVYPLSQAVAVVLMALSTASAGLRHGLHQNTAQLFTWVLLLWLAIMAWVVIQTLPLPGGLLANASWTSLQEAGIEATGVIAVAPGDAINTLLPISLPFMTFLSALLLFRGDHQVETALRVFGICGAAFAVFAILQTVLFPGMLMFAPKQSYFGSLTAPFVNRNTAATFYGLVLAVLMVCFSLSLAQSDRHPSFLERTFGKWVFLGMAVAAALALAMTQSRAGIAASIIGCGILLVTLVMHSAKRKGRSSGGFRSQGISLRRKVAFFIGAIAIVAIVGSVLFGRAMLRAERQGPDESRVCVARRIVDGIWDNLAGGIGPGSFRVYFPAYRDPACGLESTWFRAHNVFLEVIWALGAFVSLAAMLTIAAILIFTFVKGLRRRRSKKPIILGAICSVVTVFIHSTLDFSLQIPGFVMSFTLFMALAMTISLNSTGRLSHAGQ